MSIGKSTLTAAIAIALTAPAFSLPVYSYDFRQQQSFTPPHKKQRRGKFKRSGR